VPAQATKIYIDPIPIAGKKLFGAIMIQIDLYKPGIGLKYTKTLFFVLIVIINICSCQQEINSDIESGSSSITLQLTATEPEPSVDPKTDVNVTRTVIGDGNKLKFKYDVGVPSVDDFYFVLALDSSGSLGCAGDQDQAKAVITAVPQFINYTIDEYPNKTFNMSIVGWDNNIDFI